MPNVIAPNPGMEGPARLLAIIEKFDIQKSVERMRPKVAKLGALTEEIVRELYFVKKFLEQKTGQRKDPDAEDYAPYTWQKYCGDIGLPRQFANAKIRLFTPRELSFDGKDHLLSVEDAKKTALPEPAYTSRETERRIAQVMATNERPADWTKAEERIVGQRLDEKELEKIKALWMGRKFGKESSIDYFAEITSLTKGIKSFALKTDAQRGAQVAMFRAVHGYLAVFKDRETLMAAARNLTEKIHSAANYFAGLLSGDEEDL
jgi:hypothetical protein